MKNLYLTITALFLSGSIFAQEFSFSTEQHISTDLQNQNFVELDIKFVTSPAQDITFMWEAVTNTFPTEWSYSLCDFGGCYVGVPATGRMNHITTSEMQNGTDGFFKMNLSPFADGDGIVQIYVYDSLDYSKGDTVSFTVSCLDTTTAPNTGIFNVAVSASMNVFPNPATENLTISAVETLPSFQLIDPLGRVVLSRNGLTTNNETLDVSALERGIYFLSFEEKNGQRSLNKVILN